MLYFHAESKDPNASNITNHINQRIIMNSVGVAKPTRRQTYCVWKQNKTNHVHTHSNVPIVEVTIKWTPICVCFGSTDSTTNGVRKNMLRSIKIGKSQFVLSGTVNHNDL